MEQFSLIDNDKSIQSSQAPPIQLPYTDDTTAVYKPLAYADDTTAVYMPLASGTSPAHLSTQPAGDDSTLLDTSIPVSTEQSKRKRGRPRKYTPYGSSSPSVKQPADTGFGGLLSSSSGKKRGRPLGSGRKCPQAFGGSSSTSLSSSSSIRGSGFTAHVITVETGEDIASKILSVAESELQALCIITATGTVSNVTIRQNGSTPAGTVSYEGRFEIVTLSGSYIVSETGGLRKTSGGISTLLAGSDGHVLGGCITDRLIAASQVQIVVGCFILRKEFPWKKARQSMAGGSSTSCSVGGGSGSPLNQTSGGGPEAPAWHQHDGNGEQQHLW